jgi:hypothetical protein
MHVLYTQKQKKYISSPKECLIYDTNAFLLDYTKKEPMEE